MSVEENLLGMIVKFIDRKLFRFPDINIGKGRSGGRELLTLSFEI